MGYASETGQVLHRKLSGKVSVDIGYHSPDMVTVGCDRLICLWHLAVQFQQNGVQQLFEFETTVICPIVM